jgi:hypothetical protein
MILPEFSAATCILGPIRAIILDNVESSYDLIIGMDLIQTLEIDIHNLSKMIVWGQLQVPFNPHDYFSSNLFQTALQDQMVGSFDEHDADEELGYKSKNLKGSLYKQHDPQHMAKQQTHLSTSQRQELTQILVRFPKLFPKKKVHLEHIGVLESCGPSEWLSPSFIIVKKDGRG